METKEKIKRYVLGDSIPDQDFDERMALIYKDKDFLLKKGLWNDDIRKKVSTYNTLHNFTNMRSIQVKDNLMAYSTLYLASKYSVQYYNQLDCDVLTLQDYFLSKGIEYAKLDTWDIIDFLQINRKPTKEFVKYLYQEGALSEANKKDPLYLSMLVEIEDINSLIERYKDIKMDVDTKFKFISRIDYKEWKKFIGLFDDEFLIKYLGCFRYQELICLRDIKRLHEIINQASYKERYKMYEKLETDQKIIEETRKELKSLVKSNLQKKIEIFKTLSNKGPNSVIEEIVNQIVAFNSLIPLVSEIIKVMDPLVKDVFVFHILRFIKSHKTFVNGDHFSKWFINTCSLIKSIQKNIDAGPVLDFIRDLTKQKRYSCVLLLESVDLPEDILKICKKVYRKVFIYEDYSLKLKMDVSDKYSVLINRKFKLKPSTANFKFMTLYEIESIKPENLDWVIKLIADTQNLEDDYFVIRNLAMIVRKFFEDLKEYYGKIKDIFEYFVDYEEEEDIRVLCCSLISKIMSYEKKKGKASYDDTTLSEPKRMKFEAVEKGEITTVSENTNSSEPKRRKIETTTRENTNYNQQNNYNQQYNYNQQNQHASQTQYSNQYQKNYHYNQPSRKLRKVYNNRGEQIMYVEHFLREYLHNDRDSFYDLTRFSNLPVFDSEGKRIVHLDEFLFGKNENNNYYDRRRW